MQLVVVVAAMFPSLSHFPTFFVNCVQKFSSNFTAASRSLLLAAAQVQLGNILLNLIVILLAAALRWGLAGGSPFSCKKAARAFNPLLTIKEQP